MSTAARSTSISSALMAIRPTPSPPTARAIGCVRRVAAFLLGPLGSTARQRTVRSPAVDVADLDYDLPERRIAQQPVEPRDAARLLVDRGPGRRADAPPASPTCPTLLDPGDLLVVNDTRVRPARLRLRKPTGGAVEVLLLEPLGDGAVGGARAPVPAGRRRAPAARRRRAASRSRSATTSATAAGAVEVDAGDPEAAGEVPAAALHPRAARRPRALPDGVRPPAGVGGRARPPGSTSPTACSTRCRGRGVGVGRRRARRRARHVPARSPPTTVEDHPMHTEAYAVPPATLDAVEAHRAAGGAVVAVGTTVVRALESAPPTGELAGPHRPASSAPATEFRAVDRLLTNFHVPRTTLLALVAAFVGARWRDLYAIALAEGYRFLSFGDAMLLDAGTTGDADRSTSTPPTAGPGRRRSRRAAGHVPHAVLHAGRHPGRGAGRRRRRPRGPRAPRSCWRNTYHLMLQAGRRRRRPPRRAAPLHRLGRPPAHRLRRLPGVQPRSAAAQRRRSTTTASRSARPTTARRTGSRPESRSRIQEQLGADIQMQLDVCPPLPSPPEVVRLAVERTLAWGERALAARAPRRRPGPVRHRAGRRRPRRCGPRRADARRPPLGLRRLRHRRAVGGREPGRDGPGPRRRRSPPCRPTGPAT